MRQFSGLDFFSAQVDSFPYHEWPKAKSDREMNFYFELEPQKKAKIDKTFVHKKGVLLVI